MKTVGIRYYSNKSSAAATVGRVRELFKDAGFVVLEGEELDFAMISDEKPEALIAVGGDGTILHTVVAAARQAVPVLGVNAGRLGFLSGVNPDGLERAVRKLMDGDYHIDSRMLLEADAGGSKRVLLNEVVIAKRMHTTVLHIEVRVDGILIGGFACDGLIVATPTGSTAYSLSAGGPILLPDADAIVITPMCAHSLMSRPFVVAAGANISVTTEEDNASLFADGVHWDVLSPQGCEICRSEIRAGFIRFEPVEFLKLMQEKLK